MNPFQDPLWRPAAPCLTVLAILCAAESLPAAEGRAFWLTRWNATDPAQVEGAIAGMAALNANTAFVQVYGDSMALHRSQLAPRSHLVAGDFDALETAIAAGHARGLAVHAYMNVLNVWSGGLGEPSDPDHIVRRHPEWSVVDADGTVDVAAIGVPETLIFFCPAWDAFRPHVVSVAVEIASAYEVDGIHLDYLRFPGGTPRCFCAEHRRKFRARFGREPAEGDPDFVEWRYADITGFFGELHDAVHTARPGIQLSASLISPTGRYFQDAKRILESGKLDIAVPMIYTGDLDRFEAEARYLHENSGGRLVYAGLLADSGVVFEEVNIARRLGLEGQAFFSYSTLDDSGRADAAALFPAPVAAPAMPWKDGTADTVPPVISGVAARGVLPDEATIVWHTDERTAAQVAYGIGAGLGSTAVRGGFLFEHAVRLSGLRPGTAYSFRAVAEDAAGNTAASAVARFTTGPGGPIEVLVDDGGEGFSRGGSWSPGSSAGGHGGGYLFSSRADHETAWAVFAPFLPRAGLYEVSTWYVAGANRAADARYVVTSSEGNQGFTVDQTRDGGTWRVLGNFRFLEGTGGGVRLSNQAVTGNVVIADAARFRLLEAERTFLRGDTNADGRPDISDGIAILGYLFSGSERPACLDAADADDSGVIEITDAIYLLNHLFAGTRAPPEPYPAPGTDRTEDGLAECR